MCLHCILEGAEIWFTSLKHHEKRERWRRVRLHAELCLRRAESSVLVAFFFKIHRSYRTFRFLFSMELGTKNQTVGVEL